MKALVVVYSWTGRTLSLARQIAEELGADLEAIHDRTGRRGLLGFLRSGYEALSGKIPPIAEPKHDPGEYDLVVIGTPIWAGRMSSPVRAYLHRFRGKLRRAAFFATSGGGGHKKALAEMARVADVEPISTLELTADQLESGRATEAIGEFIARLREAQAPGE